MSLRILIAEDEKDIADLYAGILKKRGHKVTVTYNGAECVVEYLSTCRNKKSPYDVVMIDHSMPTMSGADAAKKVLEINPKQRIIFVSGYGTELLKSLGDDMKHIELLTKPSSSENLISIVEH